MKLKVSICKKFGNHRQSSKENTGRLQGKMEFNSVESYGWYTDRLIHDYMGLNYSIVREVVKNKIPGLSN